MKLQIPLLISVLIFCKLPSSAQTLWLTGDTLSTVRNGAQTMKNPWAGGLNAVQYSKTDLDNDGIEDLVVFDRTTSKVSTFIANPKEKSYTYRQEYELLFPPLANWMLLVDYDLDGKKELFTHVAQGVRVYRQEDDGKGGWKWVSFKSHLSTKGLSGNITNLQVVASDIPALVDFDGDGDMDIVTFESEGDYVELNQNLSMERYGIPDSLEFVRNGVCWGDFRKHTCDDFQFGIDCGVNSSDSQNARIMHAGNSLLLTDLNGDGKKDMLLGNVECQNLSVLFNETDGIAARFNTYASSYPAENPVAMHIFPAAFLEDVDFDGVKDLLVSPNVYGNDDLMADFVNSGWYYRNVGSEETPDFRLQQHDFLQSDMVDVGENASVVFFDVDGDGDVDMVIGNRGRYDGTDFSGSLWLYRNNGTISQPVFELESDDYLNLSALKQTDLQPEWVDFDGDGKADLGFAAISNRRLFYYYLPNRGQPGGEAIFNKSELEEIALPTELSVSDRVHFYDFDRDGDPDLLVGGVLGNISFYENIGTTDAPAFALRTSALGGIGPSFSGRYRSLSVADLDLDGKADLAMVDQSGKVTILSDGDWGNWTKKDTSVIRDPRTGTPSSPYLGNRLQVSLADINGDGKPDLAVGTMAGGLYLFRNIVPTQVLGREPLPEFLVYPNPADDQFSIYSEGTGTIDVSDFLGNRVYSASYVGGKAHPVVTIDWKAGIYLIRLLTPGGQQVKKVVVF